jgi:hypothetical protein
MPRLQASKDPRASPAKGLGWSRGFSFCPTPPLAPAPRRHAPSATPTAPLSRRALPTLTLKVCSPDSLAHSLSALKENLDLLTQWHHVRKTEGGGGAPGLDGRCGAAASLGRSRARPSAVRP